MEKLPKPLPGAIIYEDEYTYVCLANFPITPGHTVVVWKRDVTDLHLLKRDDYTYLMDIVEQVRNALLSALELEKIYLMYMDEIKHVHWHLVPRYDVQGFNVLEHAPSQLQDTSLADTIRSHWTSLN
jgi:diadenosine tetraphosphate (Ap4A) HIT family hydrolase